MQNWNFPRVLVPPCSGHLFHFVVKLPYRPLLFSSLDDIVCFWTSSKDKNKQGVSIRKSKRWIFFDKYLQRRLLNAQSLGHLCLLNGIKVWRQMKNLLQNLFLMRIKPRSRFSTWLKTTVWLGTCDWIWIESKSTKIFPCRF